jgi:uncharacterized protein YndB with AHSA1/START domain
MSASAESHPVLHKTTTIPVPRAVVWGAWTDQSKLATWFGSEARVELRIGGPYEILFLMDNPPGLQGGEGNTVQSFNPEHSLTITWNAPPDFGALRDERTRVHIALADVPTGTTVSLTHDGWGYGPEWNAVRDYFDRAWDHVLAALTAHLSSP